MEAGKNAGIINDGFPIITWREYGMRPPKDENGFALAFSQLFIGEFPNRNLELCRDYSGNVAIYITPDSADTGFIDDGLQDF